MLNVLHEINQILKFYHQAANMHEKQLYLLENLSEVEHLHIQRHITLLPYLWLTVLLYQQFDTHHNTFFGDILLHIY